MENKPNHYDGSLPVNSATNENSAQNDSFTVTDEMRANISGNPFFIESNE